MWSVHTPLSRTSSEPCTPDERELTLPGSFVPRLISSVLEPSTGNDVSGLSYYFDSDMTLVSPRPVTSLCPTLHPFRPVLIFPCPVPHPVPSPSTSTSTRSSTTNSRPLKNHPLRSCTRICTKPTPSTPSPPLRAARRRSACARTKRPARSSMSSRRSVWEI